MIRQSSFKTWWIEWRSHLQVILEKNINTFTYESWISKNHWCNQGYCVNCNLCIIDHQINCENAPIVQTRVQLLFSYCFNVEIELILLDYIHIYSEASTINLSFWLSLFFDMISEANVIRGHGMNLNHSSFIVEYAAPEMRMTRFVSTLLFQRVLVWQEYITYPWLSYFLTDNV